jgi:NADPH2:quinone reductase
MRHIQVTKFGGPEELKLAESPKPTPAAGQALVKIAASGVNYIDVYFRTGLNKADLPFTPGSEASGTVESVGPGVTAVKPGDRVGYAMARGSYAEYALVPADQLVPLPDSVEFNTAAAALLQGMTAHYLTHSTYAVKPGDKCLVHAAAGGAGRLVVQMAKMLGATVYGTVGTDAKAAVAKEAGADEAIVYTRDDFAVEVKRLTGGKGVDVIYDSVGLSSFLKGLDLLRPRGMMALFGNSSGKVDPIDPAILNPKGSLFLTRPSLAHYVLTREELLWRAGDVLSWIGSRKLKLLIDKTYPLSDAAESHRDLEGRKTIGKLLIIP